MNEETLKWAQEQLSQLRKPSMEGRQYKENEEEERNEPGRSNKKLAKMLKIVKESKKRGDLE